MYTDALCQAYDDHCTVQGPGKSATMALECRSTATPHDDGGGQMPEARHCASCKHHPTLVLHPHSMLVHEATKRYDTQSTDIEHG